MIARAARIHEEASSLGFDWPDATGVLAKVHEEALEISDALERNDSESAKRELGDLFFTLVNLSRFLSADLDHALNAACDRFEKRFVRVRAEVDRRGKKMSEYTLEELDVIWEQVKAEAC